MWPWYSRVAPASWLVVTAIAQAADGRLAVGTPAGAVYFDSLRFSYVVRDPASSVQRGWVEALAAVFRDRW